MRKLIVSMNVSLDGFMSGPNCELDWHFQKWTNEMADSLCEELSRADTILLGRVTYKAMAGYWPVKAGDVSFPRTDIAFADMMNSYTKIVFSHTLTRSEWENSKLLNGDLEREIRNLKRQAGRDMIIYGSGKLVSALMQLDLIDEYQLWIHPVLLGKGKSFFRILRHQLNLRLFNTRRFDSGVVVLYYEPVKPS